MVRLALCPQQMVRHQYFWGRDVIYNGSDNCMEADRASTGIGRWALFTERLSQVQILNKCSNSNLLQEYTHDGVQRNNTAS